MSDTPDMGGDELGVAGFNDGHRYQAARPDYPAEAVAFLVESLGLDETAHVVDLGAGTGILTAQLLPRCRTITAVEPTESMREVLAARLPSVRVLDGRDTAIPLESGVADAVVVAQAFHWFDAPRALDEIHRVLVPGGGLGLIWNERDESVGWVDEVSVAMRWYEQRPYAVGMDFSPIVAAGPFVDVQRRQFRHTQTLDRQGLRERVLTTSYIAVMDDDDQAALMRDVAEVIDRLPEPVVLPYVTDVYRATAVEPRPGRRRGER